MENHTHNHEKVFKEICDYLGGDLDSPQCLEVKRHLESCPECAVYFDSIKKTVHLCRENEVDLKTPNACKDKILKSLNLSIPPDKK